MTLNPAGYRDGFAGLRDQLLPGRPGLVAWRWMFASAALPSALFMFALLVPESPRWLLGRGREAGRPPCPPQRPGRRRCRGHRNPPLGGRRRDEAAACSGRACADRCALR
ncbi:MAG: MFS transporter [Hymenobacter sp.]